MTRFYRREREVLDDISLCECVSHYGGVEVVKESEAAGCHEDEVLGITESHKKMDKPSGGGERRG